MGASIDCRNTINELSYSLPSKVILTDPRWKNAHDDTKHALAVVDRSFATLINKEAYSCPSSRTRAHAS
eukprot:6209529-Pleurochrysis_carterae.AAC.1